MSGLPSGIIQPTIRSVIKELRCPTRLPRCWRRIARRRPRHAGGAHSARRCRGHPMRIGDDMVNGHAIAHGAFVFAVADTAFAVRLQQPRPGDRRRRRRHHVRRAGPRRRRTRAPRAVERTRFGRTGIYDVTVRRGDEVVAEFRGRAARSSGAMRGERSGAGRRPTRMLTPARDELRAPATRAAALDRCGTPTRTCRTTARRSTPRV